MSNFVQNETFDATQFALDEVVAYYGEDTADSDIYEGLLDDTWRNYDYDYDYGYNHHYDSDWGAVAAFLVALFGSLIVFFIIACVGAIITIIAKWSVFKKAGQDGWEAIIPIHNEIVELKMGGIKTYWYFLNWIVFPFPIAPIVLAFWKSIKLAHSFGKGTGFGVGLALLPIVFYPILAWGSAQYIGPQRDNNKDENIFYTETNNTNTQDIPLNQPIVTNNDLSSYTDPKASEAKEEENPIKTNVIDDKTE